MKSKISLLTVITVFVFIHCGNAQDPHYEITGKIEGAEGISFTLQKIISGETIYLDTAVVSGSIFKMTGGPVDYPQMVYLVTWDRKRRFPFFLENGNITITGRLDSLGNAKVSGTKSNDEYSAFRVSLKPYSERMARVASEYRAASEKVISEMKNTQKEFIKNNPGSYVSPYLLRELTREMKPQEIENIINAMEPDIAGTQLVVEIKSGLAASLLVAPGREAPDFTLNDQNGKPVALSSKIGPRLLLIDFWAGWCGPCRLENPNVLKTYNDFNRKGFDVIGVSLDRTKAEWLKAITDDKLPWTQVSDLKYFNSAAARLYNVTAIPANFLLDEKGIIIDVNIRGEALYTKVMEILDGTKSK